MRLSLRWFGVAASAAALAACSSGGTVPVSAPQSAVPSVVMRPAHAWNLYLDGKGVHAYFPRGRQPHGKGGGSHQMIYHGGLIQKNPKIYVIYWGFNKSTADPDGVQPYENSFLEGLTGTPYFNIVTQYTSTTQGGVTDPAGEFGGTAATWVDSTNPVPSSPSSNEIAAEAVRSVAVFGYDFDASYVVQLPHGAYKKLSYCAYHSVTSTSNGDVHYTDLPYQPDLPGCGTDSVNTGAQGLLDSTSETVAHEVGETQTDPDTRTGWFDSSGNEIGDYCAYINLQNVTLSTGTFAIQPLWSNAANYCAVSYP